MTIYLGVLFIKQLNIGDHVEGFIPINDPTGCWYASICMIAYYYRKGPCLGMPELQMYRGGHFIGHSTIPNIDLPTLADRENLQPVPNCEVDHFYTLGELEYLLEFGGPIVLSWMKKVAGRSSYGHVSVIVGVDLEHLIYHGPEEETYNSKMSAEHLHKIRRRIPYGMMQRKNCV
jgi:hypothetical protein